MHKLLLLFSALLVIASAGHAALPDFAQVRAEWRSSEARLLDRNGVLLQEFRVDPTFRRTAWTALADISPALIAAVLQAEDQRFFQHAGVDWLAAGKAALTQWQNDKPRGASTLSMQLAGLLDARYRASKQSNKHRRNISEKWQQMQAAKALEQHWRKNDILEAYLNLVSFRGELSGIDAAARGLFDKRPIGLNDDEARILAALIRAPNAKANTVAQRVCALAPQKPCAKLKALTLNTLGGRYPILPAANWAPHFAQTYLSPAYTPPSPPTPRTPLARPQEIRSTLDIDIQRRVQAALAQQLNHLAARNVQDAAALVVDNASGAILAYVSLSSRLSAGAQNDGVQARRQAGSTLKPFLYGLAFEKRLLTAASPLRDEALSLATSSGQYTPQNYDHTFRGLVSARVALASSLNIPAVHTLQLTGLYPFADHLAKFGYGGLNEDADYYGYALALGSLDVSLQEQVNAYRSLANGGLFTQLHATPAHKQPVARRILSAEAAFLVADILADRAARAPTFGLENPLATRYWTAVKTGTSKDMRDNWCIGFSRRYSVGVWIGNFDGSPMHEVSGISGAAPAWAEIMNGLHLDSGVNPPSAGGIAATRIPSGLIRRTVQAADEAPRREWFLRGSEPAALTWSVAQAQPAITYPLDGMILALDPDIPLDRQTVKFRAINPPAGAFWQLDSQHISSQHITSQHLDSATWQPTRGKHTLVLFATTATADPIPLDQIEFSVR